MKVTFLIAVCTLVVLLQQMQTPLAQYAETSSYFYNCPLPSCSRGARFDKRACKCFDDTDSFCPLGFYPARDKKRCFCEKRTKPRCPSGLSIYGRDCVCTGDPTCPDGSTLSYSKATCSAKPYCPDGADLIDCECVRRVDRICTSGATLSRDGCDCKISYPPTCSKGCSLDSDRGCKCSIQKKQDKIWCYYGSKCSGKGTYVSSTYECCLRRRGRRPYYYDDDETPEDTDGDVQMYAQSSYRIGKGKCFSCKKNYFYGKKPY